MTETFPPVARPRLAIWLFERNVSTAAAADALAVSSESVRRYCLPFDHADRRLPHAEIMERIVAWTAGAIQPADFYPPHLTTPPVAAPSPSPEPAQ